MTGIEMLEQYRLKAGISRAGLARRLGVTDQIVYYWFKGERSPGRASIGAIERVTNGAVPVSVWFEPQARPPAPASAPRSTLRARRVGSKSSPHRRPHK